MSWRLLEKTFVNLHAGHVFVASFHEGKGMRRSWAAAAHNVKWASTAVKSFPNNERFGSTEHTKQKCRQSAGFLKRSIKPSAYPSLKSDWT